MGRLRAGNAYKSAFPPDRTFWQLDDARSNLEKPRSLLDKFYELDGHILLIGVGHEKNTSLHLAETRADFAKNYVEENSAVLNRGKREWIRYSTLDVDDEDFIELGDDYEREMKVPRHNVGMAEVRFMKQREVVDYAVKWMTDNRD